MRLLQPKVHEIFGVLVTRFREGAECDYLFLLLRNSGTCTTNSSIAHALAGVPELTPLGPPLLCKIREGETWGLSSAFGRVDCSAGISR